MTVVIQSGFIASSAYCSQSGHLIHFITVADLGQAPCSSRDAMSCSGTDDRPTRSNPKRDRYGSAVVVSA
jgi:hypothetical protein